MLTLTAVALLSAASQGSDVEMRLARYPTVHNDNVIFTFASDLWTTNIDGGIARRLTSHPGTEDDAKLSPDGSLVAFTAMYDGNVDVYVMPARGGEPKRLTYEPDGDSVVGWTPDGKVAYTSTFGSDYAGNARLWLIDPKGGVPQPTPIYEAQTASFSPDGKKVAYNRSNSFAFNWRRYRGGTHGRVSVYDLEKNSYMELPTGRENAWHPMWIGDSIYFLSDKNQNTVNLYRYEVGSKKITQVTKYSDIDIRYPSTDGKTIVFERDGYLYRMNVASGDIKRIDPEVVGDMLASRPQLKELGNNISYMSLSPSGARLVAEARGEIFSVPAKNGETRNMSETTTARERFASWSPDGQSIAYISDRGGDYQIFVEPQMGGEETKITAHQAGSINGIEWSPDSKKIAFTTNDWELWFVDVATKQATKVAAEQTGPFGSFDWSPDSKWIAYVTNGANLLGSVSFYELASGKSTKVTEGYYGDTDVSFDISGKYLYLISGRTIDPASSGSELNVADTAIKQRVYMMVLSKDEKNPLVKPSDEEPAKPATPPAPGSQAGAPQQPAEKTVRVDLEGLGDRVLPLPVPPGTYGFVVGGNEAVYFPMGGQIQMFNVKDGSTTPVFAGVPQGASFNPSRTKMAYLMPGIVGIVDLRPGAKPGDGRVNVNDVEAWIDPRDEWKQMYWDAWRYERDFYYDPKYLGMDWRAIGEHYAKYLPYVRSRGDLNYVLGMLIGEFGTSHAYVGGGDAGVGVPAVPIGSLGADYEVANGKIRFKRILRGLNFEEPRRGPLGEPGVNVNVGDYLLAIDGKPVDANTNPHMHLMNKAGKTVVLTVNDKPTMDGARKVEVRPTGNEFELRYIDWVERNRKRVNEATNGRVGYLHVPNTSEWGGVEFVKGYYSHSDREGLIVDERFNGGGYIPTFFVERLQRDYDTFIRGRRGMDIGFPVQSVSGPKVMLINEYAGSGGDHIAWLFKTRGVGKLIGKRTWGGLVGISGTFQLADGGFISAPAFGLYDPKEGKWIAENTGVEPDIEVDARPDLIAQGRDPQLEKAIEVVMAELKKTRPARKAPDFPKIPKGGGGG